MELESEGVSGVGVGVSGVGVYGVLARAWSLLIIFYKFSMDYHIFHQYSAKCSHRIRCN